MILNGTHTQFGFGDDYKMVDVLKEIYDIQNANPNFVEGVYVKKLSTIPNIPFEDRKQDLMKYLRKDNNPFYEKSRSDGKVFEPKE